ncbi:MAG: NADH-quinone oxidoreductase subunit C [Paracoccus sp. (in: a-proteobacteria)]|nr:NADH-quinone oxidoreductase subunit C [Paracoccus sp. (in: a-proteobacteria)]
MAFYPDVEALDDLATHITAARGGDVLAAEIAYEELTLTTTPGAIIRLVEFLRSDPNCRFTTLIDITAVDLPERAERFDVVYHFLSMYRNQRIRVKFALPDGAPAPSLTELLPGANWYEREIFDMFGIAFTGHPDLRRILTDYGFQGFPLRKDFPTTGYVEVRYDDAQRKVIYEPVKLVQEYRQFDFLSPWEGAKYILPGDEKAEEAK